LLNVLSGNPMCKDIPQSYTYCRYYATHSIWPLWLVVLLQFKY